MDTLLPPAWETKLRLMTHGLRVSEPAMERLSGADGQRPITLADYASTSGLSLCLEGEVWVNAPLASYNPNFVIAPQDVLELDEQGFFVTGPAGGLRARPVPVPDYQGRLNRWGKPFTDYAHTHTDRVRISPVRGCSFACSFCDLSRRFTYATKPVEALIDAVDRAQRDQALPANHVLISGGTPRPEDFGYLHQVWREVPAAFPDMPVDVMMTPVPGLMDARWLLEAGVHGLSVNLELWGEASSRRWMKGKNGVGREQVLDFIEEAARVFGLGKVRSLLMLGLEDLDDTLAGVQALAERGCDPVLSPFRPDLLTPLAEHPPPSAELMREAWLRSAEIVDRYPGVYLGPRCFPCQHNTLAFPVEP